MKTRRIGDSDLVVPIICLGTMTWGQQNSEEDAHEQLNYAIDERGLNFIDTAEIYPIPPESHLQGRTESYIGNWLKKHGGRDKLTIATKIGAGNFISTRHTGPVPRYDRKSIRDAVEGSLQRLNTDYIDLYQVHFPERKANFFGVRAYPYVDNSEATPIEETLEALNELVLEGKIRYLGVSNETAWGVSEYLRVAREKGYSKIVSIQNQYSLTNRTFEIALSEFCHQESLSLLAYSPLNMGVLTGKYLDNAKPQGSRFTVFKRNQDRYNPPHAQETFRKYVELAQSHNIDPAKMAISFVNSRPFVASTIVGATNLAQLKIAIDAGEMTLDEDILNKIEDIYLSNPDATV